MLFFLVLDVKHLHNLMSIVFTMHFLLLYSIFMSSYTGFFP